MNKIALLRKNKQIKKVEKTNETEEWLQHIEDEGEPPGYDDI